MEELTSRTLQRAQWLTFLAGTEELWEAFRKGELTGLAPYLRKGIVMTRGRLSKGMYKVFRVLELMVLMPNSDLAQLMILAHWEDH